MARALIVEHGFNRGSLAAARGLHAAGWTVDLASTSESVTRASRTIRCGRRLPFSVQQPGPFVQAVASMIEATDSDVVFPVDETQLLLLSEHREQLSAVLPYPEHEVLLRATDRLEQVRAASEVGLATPATWLPTAEDLGAETRAMVVKARRPTLVEVDGAVSRAESLLCAPADTPARVADLQAHGIDAILQEVVTGYLASVTVLTDSDGVLVATAHQRALRLWPPSAGTSARATSIPADAPLDLKIQAFLNRLGWHGFAQLQFLVDAQNTPYLIDFNPRFYGSLSLAIGSGVNFPAMWGASALDMASPTGVTARVGVRYHWLGGDLRRAVRERRDGLLRDVAGSLLWGGSAVHPIWSATDPLPAVGSAMAFLRR